MRQRPVFITGYGNAGPAEDFRRVGALVARAVAEGKAPVFAHFQDQLEGWTGSSATLAGLVGAAGGEFWVIEQDERGYDEVSQVAFRAWLEGLDVAGVPEADHIKYHRRSGPWSWWEHRLRLPVPPQGERASDRSEH